MATSSSTSTRSLCFGLFTILCAFSPHESAANKTVVDIDLNDPIVQQRIRLFTARKDCFALIVNVSAPSDGGSYCPPVWDNILCWPDYVPADTVVSQPCPGYIYRFNHEEDAVRRCTENGTWEQHPDPKYDGDYTDFANCDKPAIPAVIMEHMPIVTKISTVGYSVSIVALVLAIFILVYFKKLHCQRNTIHINLFVSFGLRAVISVIRNTLLVKGLALPSDIIRHEDGSIEFKHEGDHWECKLLNTLWFYALLANYFWIFVEGLYLHTLIFFAVFSQTKQFFKLYILVGWVLPLFFVITWVVVRTRHHNELCWNIHTKGYFWIIEAPIMLTICVNFFFFLNIVRVLFTKIRDCNTGDPKRYKKLAKSTLVLIPMFGVYYTVFIILSRIDNPAVSVVHIYLELPVNSFQGAVVAMLFCFCNGEVQAEILKRWDRHRLRSVSLTSGRSSRAFSTGSFYTGRDRTSVCLGTVASHVTSYGDSEGNGSGTRVSVDRDSNVRDGQSAFPRVSSSPRVSFRGDDSVLVETDPYTQTLYPGDEGGPKVVPDCGEGGGEQVPERRGFNSLGTSELNRECTEEQMVLIPAENFGDHPNPAPNSLGKGLSLVRGGLGKENGTNSKRGKGGNNEINSTDQISTDINQLSPLDSPDAGDESQPILG